MTTIKVPLEEDVVALLQQSGQPAEQAVRELVVLELYRQGRISSGKGAELLGMTRLAFIQYSGERGIPYFNLTPEELDEELEWRGLPPPLDVPRPAAPDLPRLVQGKRQDILDIVAHYGGRNVRVFGSVARGEPRPGSDLDLLIQLEPNRSLLDLGGMQQDLEDLLGCRVDVVTEAALSPYMRDGILQEATPL